MIDTNTEGTKGALLYDDASGTVSYNIFKNTARCMKVQSPADAAAIVNIYNNVFGSYSADGLYIDNDSFTTVIKNNIFGAFF